MGYAMRKKLTALLLACLLLVCLVLPVSAADAPALYGTANAADGTVTVTLSLRGGSAVRSGAFTLSYDSSLTLSKTEKGLPLAVANTKKGRLQLGWWRSRGRSGRADADVHERSDEELYLQGVRRQGDGQEL